MQIEISNKELTKLLKEFKRERETKRIKKLEEGIAELKKQLRRVEQMARTPNCLRCGSASVILNGCRPTLRRGEIQKFKCLDCGHRFSNDTAFGYRMRSNEETIKQALAFRKEGFTLSEIAEKIGGVTRQTVHRWLQKYQPPVEEKIILKKQKNQFGEYEREYKIKV